MPSVNEDKGRALFEQAASRKPLSEYGECSERGLKIVLGQEAPYEPQCLEPRWFRNSRFTVGTQRYSYETMGGVPAKSKGS